MPNFTSVAHLVKNIHVMFNEDPTKETLSKYGFFHYTFIGFNFFDTHTKTTKTKNELFWRDPELALTMAKNLMIPVRYKLVLNNK